MPLDLQPYLLRVLEDGVVYRIGCNEGRPVRIRLLAMTHRDLLSDVNAGRFRRDLYYRIASMRLIIPPLRDRGDDVVLLAHRFAALAAAGLDRSLPHFDHKVLDLFRAYSWPGNVRELENVIGHACMMALGDTIDISDLPAYLQVHEPHAEPMAAIATAAPDSGVATLEEQERLLIVRALQSAGGNQSQAARLLRIGRDALRYKMKKFNLR